MILTALNRTWTGFALLVASFAAVILFELNERKPPS